MRRLANLLTCLSIACLLTTPALAGNGKGKGKGQGNSNRVITAPGRVAPCPPGLAKKNPPCIPPGQAKKYYGDYRPRYDVGEYIRDDYRIIRDAPRYGLRDDYLYYLVGREVFRISPETGRVIAFIGLADALLN